MTLLTSGNILLIGSILLFVSIAVSKTSARFGVPTLLLFLFVGTEFLVPNGSLHLQAGDKLLLISER